MRRILLLSLVLLLATAVLAWADAYKLVMSKDRKLCPHIVNLFNADVMEYGEIRYDLNELFRKVPWERLDLGGNAHGCVFVKTAVFDINNDGKKDLVLRTSMCLRSQLSDELYVFPPDSEVVTKLHLGYGGFEALNTTPNKFDRTGHGYFLEELGPAENEGRRAAIGGVFTLQPFIWTNRVYVSMTDLYPEWVVIAEYLQKDQFRDICYFHGPSFRYSAAE